MLGLYKKLREHIKRLERACLGLKPSQVEEVLFEADIRRYLLPVAYDDDSGLFLLETGDVGFVVEALPFPLVGIDTVQKLYTNLFQDVNLPEGTVVQFTLWGSPRVEPLFWSFKRFKTDTRALEESIENLRKGGLERDAEILEAFLADYGKKGELLKLLDFFETFLKEKTQKGLTPSWRAAVRDVRLFVAFKFPVKDIRALENPRRKEELWKLKERVKTSLKVIGFPYRELSGEDYVKVFRSLLNPSYETDFLEGLPYSERREIREQLILEGTLLHQLDDGRFRLGGYTFQTFTVPFGYYGFPKEVSFVDVMELWGSIRGIDSYQLSVPFLLSWVGKKLTDKEVSSLLATGDVVLKQRFSGVISKLKERQEDFYLLLQKRKEENEAIWSANVVMTLYGKESDEVEENGELFQKMAANLGYRFLREELPLPYFLSQIPLNAYDELFNKILGRSQVLLAENCPHLVPISADWKGTETPAVPLVSRRGQQFFFHLWDTDGGSNYAIVAPMGAGKSFFGNHLLFNYATLPNSLIRVIDIGDSYWGLCQLLGGRYERFSVSKSCINPFHFITPEGGETQISFLVNLIGALGRWNKPITDEEKGLITQALLRAIERWGRGFDLVDVVNIMREIAKARKNKELVEFAELAFTPWLPSGQYGNLLNGEPTLKFDNRFIVLELGEARDDYHLLAIVLISYLFMTTKEIMNLPRNIYKILHIDEAWRVLQTKHFLVMDAIEQGIREYRKFGGALGIVTQYIKDLFPTDNDPISQKLKAMKNNIEFFFLFRQPPEEWERMAEDKDVHLSEFEITLAKTVKTVKGEFSEAFVISRSRGRGIARVVVPPEFRWLYTTDPKEVQRRNEIYAQTGDIKKTVQILAAS